VVGQDVDRGGRGVLVEGLRVVDGTRRVVGARDGDVRGGAGAAVEGVGEVVCAAVVRVGRVGQVGSGVGDRHRAVGAIRLRCDRLRAAVDVGVVGQDVDRRGRGVLVEGLGVVDRTRRV